MGLFYNILIILTRQILKFIGLFNNKIKSGVTGRANTFKTLEKSISKNDTCIWFHCSSLGEYEQGLPVFKEIRKYYHNHKIVLTFFSPSGYEIRKNTDVADLVVYLPLDTKQNAKHFLDIISPELVVFVKYDIWPNYLKELNNRNHRAILIAALFRKNQFYFNWFGGFMRQKLYAFEHIFTQDENSKVLLNSIDYSQVTVSGDTRFDRVYSQLEQNNSLEFIEKFKNDSLCLVAGSTWPEDEAILLTYLNNLPENQKVIIAPHNIKHNQIQKLKSAIKNKVVLFSEKDDDSISNNNVLIIDTIGLLTKIYSYADIAYVGGAIGNTGLHNILEPGVFGIPIIIGNNHEKFPEAKQMIENGGVFEIKNTSNFKKTMDKLTYDESLRSLSGAKNFNYIKKNKGSVIQIMDYIRIST